MPVGGEGAQRAEWLRTSEGMNVSSEMGGRQ